LESALIDYEKAIKIDPKNFLAYYKCGSVWFHKKDFDKAIKNFNTAIQLNPKHVPAFYDMSCAYSIKQETGQAIKYLEIILKNNWMDTSWIYKDPDLSFIRQTEQFSNLMNNYKNSKN
jgi:tetratricopeptide (TPR) repeat protein